MSIKEIFCQDKAISILQRALASERSAHAYIFAGIDGIGKSKTAFEWAKLLLCENPVTKQDFSDSCGKCESCRLLEADSHPDFNYVYKELLEFTRDGRGRDGKGKKTPLDLPIDVIREFLIEKVSARPSLSKRRVFVISEAEKLNISSQNCLLKVLEEPPAYCTIILLCARMEDLLPTIKSRCQTIRFSTVDEEKIIEKLEQMGLEEKKAKYFARFAQGSLGQGCKWAQLELAGANVYGTKKELVKSFVSYEYADSLELAQRFLDEGKKIAAAFGDINKKISKADINRQVQKELIQIIVSVLHDAIKLKLARDERIINYDQKDLIKKLADRLELEKSSEKIAEAYKSMYWIDSSVNEKLIFEQLLLNIAESDIIKI